jgi:hypothetical protein
MEKKNVRVQADDGTERSALSPSPQECETAQQNESRRRQPAYLRRADFEPSVIHAIEVTNCRLGPRSAAGRRSPSGNRISHCLRRATDESRRRKALTNQPRGVEQMLQAYWS